jgi:hypothetical protein
MPFSVLWKHGGSILVSWCDSFRDSIRSCSTFNSNSTLWRTESFLARLCALLNLKMPDLFDDHKMISRRAPHYLPWKRSIFHSGKNNHKTWMPWVGTTVGGIQTWLSEESTTPDSNTTQWKCQTLTCLLYSLCNGVNHGIDHEGVHSIV